MLGISDAAAAFLQEMHRHAHAAEEMTMRLELEKRGPVFRYDLEHPGDVRFRKHGETLLLCDKPLAEIFEHKTLDVRLDRSGSPLVIR